MAVRLRLQRLGVRNNPHYRIVAADRRAKRDGKFLELLGNYDPIPSARTGLKSLQIKKERALYWLAVGAEPSDRVAWLFAKAGLLPELPAPMNKTVSAQPKKKAQQRLDELKKKEAEAAKKAAEEASKPKEAAPAAAAAEPKKEAAKAAEKPKEQSKA